jgi:hypothetical protein
MLIYFPRLTPFGCMLLAPSDKRMTLLNKTSIPAQNSSPLEKATSHVSIKFYHSSAFESTVKPVYNGHPWDLKKAAV